MALSNTFAQPIDKGNLTMWKRIVMLGLAAGISAFPSPSSAQKSAAQETVTQETATQDKAALKEALLFHAPFDGSVDARVVPTGGDAALYTADTLERKSIERGNHSPVVSLAKDAGRFGDALRFSKKTEQVVFFKASSAAFQPGPNWEGTVSFWLRLDPDKDLEPGYCDPLQFAEREWNDATFFVDFDKDLPRDLRLGAFPDYASWNPKNTLWEQIPVESRPMVVAKRPPFAHDKWTHVAFTFENVNSDNDRVATAILYLDGKWQGSLENPMRFTWNESTTGVNHPPAAILLGIYYIGDMDDVAVFRRALSADEILTLHHLEGGVSAL